MNLPSEEIYASLTAGKLTGQQAIPLLQAHGLSEYEAQESVFIHLGGDDVIETRADGKDYYVRSGKSVDEVEAAMNGPDPSP